MKKRLLALLLSGVLAAAALAGCGSSNSGAKKDTAQTSQESDYVYVAEYFDWGVELSENDWINVNGVVNGYMTGIYQSYDDVTYTSIQELWAMKLSDGSLIRIPVELENPEAYVNFWTIKEDGTAIVCAAVYHWDEKSQTSSVEYTLLYLDAEGNPLNSVDINAVCKEIMKDDEWNRPQEMLADAEGTLFLRFDQQIVVLDQDGSKLAVVECSDWIHSMGQMADGSVYVSYSGRNGYVLAVIDKAAGKLGTSYDLNGYFDGFSQIAADNQLYYSDGSAVRKHDLTTGENEILVKWLDCDIIGNFINGVACENEDTIYAYYSNWETDEESFIKLVKTERSQVAEKQTITIAALTANNSEVENEIVSFNKNSDKYRIELTTYLDYTTMSDADFENYEQFVSDAVTHMKNDLTGQNPPDIICMSDDYINAGDLVKVGLLEELTPYLEQAGYSEEDFLDGVINSCKIDGKLYSMPSKFSLYTAVANSAYVGTEAGWTLEDVLETVEKLPEGVELMSATTKENFVTECLMFGYDKFIDTENARCHFDSEEFKALLEIAQTFPKEYTYEEDAPSEPSLLSKGEIVMLETGISELNDIQVSIAYLGNHEATFIGLPGAGGNGCLIAPYGSNYAICTKSDVKDAAAAFIIDTLTKEYKKNDDFYWGFPSLKASFEAYVADQLDVAYLKDEKGELILDEDGNPIPEEGSHSYGWGDWEYTCHPATEEEADILRELINGARGTYSYNTELFSIIMEELDPFFNNQQSADQVAAVIQNRISLYLVENS